MSRSRRVLCGCFQIFNRLAVPFAFYKCMDLSGLDPVIPATECNNMHPAYHYARPIRLDRSTPTDCCDLSPVNGGWSRWKLSRFCYFRADSRFSPSQWETALLSNDVSNWLGASLKSSLYLSWFWHAHIVFVKVWLSCYIFAMYS